MAVLVSAAFNCLAQNITSPKELIQQYALQSKNNIIQQADKYLVQVNKDFLPLMKTRYKAGVLRQINETWFILKLVKNELNDVIFDTILPANNNYKLSPSFFVDTTLKPDGIYNFIIKVTDSSKLAATLKKFKSQQFIYAYQSFFSLRSRLSFIIDTLINYDYVLSVGTMRQPQEESVINNYDNSVNGINLFYSKYPSINGNGLTVSVKENLFDTSDIDFKGRYILSSNSANTITTHATIMATIIAGSGNSFQSGKGIAWASRLSSSNFANLLPDADAYFKQNNITVQNNSYGVGVENFYGIDAAAYDESTISNPSLLYVFSAGNSGNVTPADGRYKGISGFANITGSFKQAKNIIIAGAVDSFYHVPKLSSKGPAYDGRIKPEVVAYGTDGSSGAAAIASGAALAVQSAYASVHHDSLPQNALVKAILINSAEDIFKPGPDFYSGYGNINVFNAAADAVSNHFISSAVQQDEEKNFSLHIPPNITHVKITLVWNDAPAQPNAFTALVNDLDLSFENMQDHSVYLPWVLNSNANASTLLNTATRQRDSLNNIEQVTISNPPAGNYIIHVKGYAITTAPQPFFIVYRFDTAKHFSFISPVSNTHFIAGGNAIFRWQTTYTAINARLEYSMNKGVSWQVINGNINLSKKYFNWIAPDTNVIVIARMIINNEMFYSDTFDISRQIFPKVGFVCNDSALIYWNKQPAINNYSIFNLTDKYLQQIAVTGDTAFVIKQAASPFVAVAALSGNHTYLNSYTFNYTAQGVGCYISNFLADADGDNGLLKLFLGTIFNIQKIEFQQQTAAAWNTIFTTGTTNNNYLQYSTPLEEGINIYRAAITLKNGVIIYSNNATINYFSNRNFIIVPNPVPQKKGFNLLSENIASNTLLLFDVMGRKRLEQKIAQQYQHISTTTLSAGVYLIVIVNEGNGIVYKTKIIVQ